MGKSKNIEIAKASINNFLFGSQQIRKTMQVETSLFKQELGFKEIGKINQVQLIFNANNESITLVGDSIKVEDTIKEIHVFIQKIK